MPEYTDWNSNIIAQFRANEGRVGPPFQGAPLTLVHHRGRKTGTEHVSPMMYLASRDDSNVMYVFATKSGAPDNPAWYGNLLAAGKADVEVGTETFPVSVREVTGAERDRIYAEQARRYPTFGEYETKTAGIRTIPVLELRRAA
jgi:deazaflavin-dependent oxidoreductase (nitroreductase family)